MSYINTGYLDYKELEELQTPPSKERYEKGPVAVIECVQEIPCNPCEAVCSFGAIHVGDVITNLPKLEENKCTGCGICVSKCPGLAIFIVDKSYSKEQATVSFPYEYYPIPEAGQIRQAVDRKGKVVCQGEVVKVVNPKSFDATPLVTLAIPKEYADVVRSLAQN